MRSGSSCPRKLTSCSPRASSHSSLWQKSWQAEAHATWCRRQLIHRGGAGAFACEPGGMGLLPQAAKLKRGPTPGTFFHDKGRGNGYILTYGGKRFYIAGDTEGIPEMRALKNIDVAFVPMNLPYTMTPEEAADAVRAFHPKVVYPYHYKGSDLQVFKKALAGSGIDVRLV